LTKKQNLYSGWLTWSYEWQNTELPSVFPGSRRSFDDHRPESADTNKPYQTTHSKQNTHLWQCTARHLTHICTESILKNTNAKYALPNYLKTVSVYFKMSPQTFRPHFLLLHTECIWGHLQLWRRMNYLPTDTQMTQRLAEMHRNYA